MKRENARYLLKRAEALLDSIKLLYEIESKDQAEYSKMTGYSSHKTFAVQLNSLVFDVRREFADSQFMVFDTDKMLSSFDSVYMYRKAIFDGVFIEVGKIKAFLESKLESEESEIAAVLNLITTKLRSIIRVIPSKEIEVQDKIEDLLVAKGYIKGNDFDRETGRIKTGLKESVPDFILSGMHLCIEVKLVKNSSGPREITEQMNADITSYSKKYQNIFFVIYDNGGFIQNIDEFKYNIAMKNVFVEVIKH